MLDVQVKIACVISMVSCSCNNFNCIVLLACTQRCDSHFKASSIAFWTLTKN